MAKVAAPEADKQKPATAKRAAPAEIMPVPAQITAKIAKKAAAPAAVVEAKPVLNESKETIMENTTTNFAQPVTDAFGEYQTRAKAAYDKGTATLTDATEFAKGNVEALVESTRILSAVGRPVARLVSRLTPGQRLLILSADGETPAAVAAAVVAAGYGASELTVLEQLGGPAERALGAMADDLDRLALGERPLHRGFNILGVARLDRVGHGVPLARPTRPRPRQARE